MKHWILIAGIMAALLLIAGVWRPGSIQGMGNQCLGSWTIDGYDAVKQEVTISASASNIKNSGNLCYGNTLEHPANINNKAFCNSFFGAGSWNEEFSKCVPTSENWFNDKEIKSSFGNCVTTCTDSRGCGGVGLGAGQSSTGAYSLGFNGITASLPTPYNSWTPISCSGGFIVGYKQSQSQSPPSTGSVVEQNQEPNSQPSQVSYSPYENKSLIQKIIIWIRINIIGENL